MTNSVLCQLRSKDIAYLHLHHLLVQRKLPATVEVQKYLYKSADIPV